MVGLSDAEVYREYARELTGFATAAVGPSDAEDVVASGVLRAMSSPRWPSIENRRAYLYRAVLSDALNVRRLAGRRARREARAAVPGSVEPSPADRDVLVVLARLSVRQRAAPNRA
jgi:DNA-directed RNA polymerase specialized sigma24 family protein